MNTMKRAHKRIRSTGYFKVQWFAVWDWVGIAENFFSPNNYHFFGVNYSYKNELGQRSVTMVVNST